MATSSQFGVQAAPGMLTPPHWEYRASGAVVLASGTGTDAGAGTGDGWGLGTGLGAETGDGLGVGTGLGALTGEGLGVGTGFGRGTGFGVGEGFGVEIGVTRTGEAGFVTVGLVAVMGALAPAVGEAEYQGFRPRPLMKSIFSHWIVFQSLPT